MIPRDFFPSDSHRVIPWDFSDSLRFTPCDCEQDDEDESEPEQDDKLNNGCMVESEEDPDPDLPYRPQQDDELHNGSMVESEEDPDPAY